MAKKKLPGQEKGEALDKRVIAEIVGKVEDYESGMSNFMSEIGEWADLYKAKRPARKRGAFSNPRLTEFYRGCTALSSLMFRMMTAADPYFSCTPVDTVVSYDDLDTLVHVFKTQLKYSKYKQNLLRACNFVVPFGTVIAQEDYRIIGVSPFGRRLPVTTFTPRVLDQVFFDRGTIDIDYADWLATSDVTSSSALLRLAQEDSDLGAAWNKEALEEAANLKEESNTINPKVLQRLTRNNSFTEDVYLKKKELILYYGKLDTLNDGIEYVVGLINRKILVRFHANKFQHGKRQFRIAKWGDFDTPLGLGVGQLLSPTHKTMDGNMQRIQDSIAFATYSPWKRRKNTVDDEDLEIRPMQIINVDNPDDLTTLDVPVRGAEMGLKLDEILRQEFRSASGATDTLQAIPTDVTASASVLAQNEGMRRISVLAEQAAETLVREHLEVIHWNNVQNIRAPFNINKAGIAKKVYPENLRVDLEFENKVVTDKDFKSQRLEKLINLTQILVSTKSQHPDQMSISIIPLIKEIAYMLDVNPNDVIQNPGERPIMGADQMASLGSTTIPTPGMSPGQPGMASVPGGDALVSQ